MVRSSPPQLQEDSSQSTEASDAEDEIESHGSWFQMVSQETATAIDKGLSTSAIHTAVEKLSVEIHACGNLDALAEDARATLRGRLETLHRTLSGSDGSSTGRITSASPVSTSTRLRQPVSPPSLEPPPREAPAIYSAAMPEPLARAPHGYGQHVSGSCPLPLHSLNDTSPPFVGTEPITSSESPSEGNQDQLTWPAGHPFAQRGPSERWQQL